MSNNPILSALRPLVPRVALQKFQVALNGRRESARSTIDGAPLSFWPLPDLEAGERSGTIAHARTVEEGGSEAHRQLALHARKIIGERTGFHVEKGHLVVVLAARPGRRPAYVFVLSKETLRTLLLRIAKGLPKERGEGQKLITAVHGIMQGTAARDLARKHGFDHTVWSRLNQRIGKELGVEKGAIASTLGMGIATELSYIADDHAETGRIAVGEYRRLYMPPSTELRWLPNPENPSAPAVPVYVMGPADGRPLVVLHAMVLHGMSEADVALFEQLRIRAYFPLRHGKLDPWALQLPHDEYLRDAQSGVEAVARAIGDTSFHLAGIISSCGIAMNYALKNPHRVSDLSMIAAVVGDEEKPSGARNLSLAVQQYLESGASSALLWRPIAKWLRDVLFREESFGPFIRKHFRRTGGADEEVIAAELASEAEAFGGTGQMGRFRYAFLNSLESVRHDFLERRAPDWRYLGELEMPVVFIHGEEDALHPIRHVRALVQRSKIADVHGIPKAGQLVYERFFPDVLASIAARMPEN